MDSRAPRVKTSNPGEMSEDLKKELGYYLACTDESGDVAFLAEVSSIVSRFRVH